MKSRFCIDASDEWLGLDWGRKIVWFVEGWKVCRVVKNIVCELVMSIENGKADCGLHLNLSLGNKGNAGRY